MKAQRSRQHVSPARAALHRPGAPAPGLHHGLARSLGNRALARALQRAQIGGVTTPARGNPHFVYELDAAIDSYPKLASHYGVGVAQIAAENPDAVAGELRHGQKIRVPAFNPPPADSQPKEAGAARVVKGKAGATVPVLWSRGGNKVGDIEAGRSVFVFSGGEVDVPIASIKNPAAGIVKEMESRNLIFEGMMLFGHIDSAQLEESGGKEEAASGWSRKHTSGPDLMDGRRPSYQVWFDHVLPSVPEGVTQLWQVVETRTSWLTEKCKLETDTHFIVDIVTVGERTAINDSWGWVRNEDLCFAMEVNRAAVGFDNKKSNYTQQTSKRVSEADAKGLLKKMAGPKGTYSGTYTFAKSAYCTKCAKELKELQDKHGAPDGEALAIDGVGKWP